MFINLIAKPITPCSFYILFQEKEKELDTRNIYANRMLKTSSRKEAENGSKRKGRSGSSKSNYTTVLFTFLPGHIQSIPTTSRQVMTP